MAPTLQDPRLPTLSLPAAVSRALGARLLGLTLTSAALAQSAPALSLKRGVNALGYDPIWKDPPRLGSSYATCRP